MRTRVRGARRRLVVVAMVAVAALGVPPVPARAAHDPAKPIDAPSFREVGRVAVEPVPGDTDLGRSADTSGWLILNPRSRRGYRIVEMGSRTMISSFDLDTLRPRHRAVLVGLPIAGTDNTAAENTFRSAEVVHAVDQEAGRIYLPLAGLNPPTVTRAEERRMVDVFVVIDEARFDRDPDRAFGTFTFPLDQKRLTAYPLLGMAVNRHGTAPGRPGKLVAAFASAQPVYDAAIVTPDVPAAPYDHTLVQWDAGAVPTGTGPPQGESAAHIQGLPVYPGALAVGSDWAEVLTACATATMSSPPGKNGYNFAKSYQWGILPTERAVFLGCQSAMGSGAVVEVRLDPLTGRPAPNGQRTFPLGQYLGDVLADQAGGLLLLRTFGDGSTYWTFDTRTRRYTGAVAETATLVYPPATGMDPSTGRLYILAPDECVLRPGPVGPPSWVPVRGGVKAAEPRVEPVASPSPLLPELAFPGHYALRVDPVTRRVFVRLGHPVQQFHHRYPACNDHTRERHDLERVYRVFEDRTAPVHAPKGLEDADLTTDVAEEAGTTEASYLGAGAGYGARALLIGGLDAPTQGAPTSARSLCGRDDREALVGSVGKVEVSSQSTVAEAAALDADARTQEALGDPTSRCRPQSGQASVDRCHGDVRELAFDQPKPGAPDDNGDGCPDRDGRNRYAARCLGARSTEAPGFDDADHRADVARDGFQAGVDCDDRAEKASASASGSLRSAALDDALGTIGPVRVAHASSKVTVSRKLGDGVTVKVDSIARGVELLGIGTIGVVRAEATSRATGRVRAASGSFKRTICDVDIAGLVVSGCLGDESQQEALVQRINEALGGDGEIRLRKPDDVLAAGTTHGYLAGIQRHRFDAFTDQALTRDRSLAVPALEVILFQGEGGAWGAGRQVVHLAGVQASTSYGITCLYGRAVDRTCASERAQAVDFGDDLPPDAEGTSSVDPGVGSADELPAVATDPAREHVVTRLLRAVPRAIAEALRLLFNNPRELGLLAVLWAMLYAPCYLGDRRRALQEVAARRL